MIRAVLDANVLASGAVASSGPLAAVTEAWIRRRFRLVLSQFVLTELERTLTKPYFTETLDSQTIHNYLSLMRSRATIVILPVDVPQVATHSEDDLVLAIGAQGDADYLVTGDRQIQALGSHHGMQIVNPRQFEELLSGS